MGRVWRSRDLLDCRRPATRFAGTAEEHRSILLVDPSNNVLEFGQYEDPRLPY